jgi:hypothetical protein
MFFRFDTEWYFELTGMAALSCGMAGFLIGRLASRKLRMRLLGALLHLPPGAAASWVSINYLSAPDATVTGMLLVLWFTQVICLLGYIIVWALTVGAFWVGRASCTRSGGAGREDAS